MTQQHIVAQVSEIPPGIVKLVEVGGRSIGRSSHGNQIV
ncbi:hypothetical protein PAECIP111802_01371 [Paenibacillus allorhizosphaerae]|uniref:Uncharacterized protein n=1 Tax=Paenibacillus allorhizosphaerae TaxID=2849866 RepID=A0ABM8VDG5_9BACL|nr:hypothetical protein PAECIP111802_01371 [Paenibacillus allorhizosphaerae]